MTAVITPASDFESTWSCTAVLFAGPSSGSSVSSTVTGGTGDGGGDGGGGGVVSAGSVVSALRAGGTLAGGSLAGGSESTVALLSSAGGAGVEDVSLVCSTSPANGLPPVVVLTVGVGRAVVPPFVHVVPVAPGADVELRSVTVASRPSVGVACRAVVVYKGRVVVVRCAGSVVWRRVGRVVTGRVGCVGRVVTSYNPPLASSAFCARPGDGSPAVVDAIVAVQVVPSSVPVTVELAAAPTCFHIDESVSSGVVEIVWSRVPVDQM